MTTYPMVDQFNGDKPITHTIRWCDTAEQAAWIAKNYCDKFNAKLIDVIPEEGQYEEA